MKATLTVVIASRNCVDRIEGTVLPWKKISSEVLVVDQNSTDGTAELARKLGCVVMVNNPANGNFDLNRKLGLQNAQGDWILYIDTDERPTEALLQEISNFLEKVSTDYTLKQVAGIKIPNLFYFLGKPLKYGLYNPRSAEVRMFRKGAWDYPCEEGFHRGVTVKGEVIRFQNAYKHFNVNTLSEWFIKTNQYTEHDSIVRADNSEQIQTYSLFWDGFRFFIRHYFWKKGFLDGFRGLISVFYFMLYHLTLRVKTWEKVQLKNLREEEDYLKPIASSSRAS